MAMMMSVQLILSVQVCVEDGVPSGVIVVLLIGEGNSTIADGVTTNGGDCKTLSSYPHRRNSQPRTISTRKGYACVTDYHP